MKLLSLSGLLYGGYNTALYASPELKVVGLCLLLFVAGTALNFKTDQKT
jgi:hypothetical protein